MCSVVGCALHASWDDAHDREYNAGHRTAWLRNAIWSHLPCPLGSFRMRSTRSLYNSAQDIESLEKLLNHARPVTYLHLDVASFGDSDVPISVSKEQWRGLMEVNNLCIHTGTRLSMHYLSDICPSWENLSLTTEFDLELLAPAWDPSCLFKNIKDLFFSCRSLHGPLVLQISESLRNSGRACRVVSDAYGHHHNGFDGEPSRYQITTVSEDAVQEFDRLMYCACHTCMPCLQRENALPDGSKAVHTHRSAIQMVDELNRDLICL